MTGWKTRSCRAAASSRISSSSSRRASCTPSTSPRSLEQEDQSLRKSSTESETDSSCLMGHGGAKLAGFLSRRPSPRPSFACGMPYWVNAWEFARLKNPSRRVLSDLKPATWEKHLKWLLSEKVARHFRHDGPADHGLATVGVFDRVRVAGAETSGVKAINEKRATWVGALEIARQDQEHRNTPFHRADKYRSEMGYGFTDVFFLFICCRCLWPYSERRHHRDQQEIKQTPVPHFQHGQGQGAGRHAQTGGHG